jgi:DNA-binding winged helix-turn-helix (wHTH) protein/Flp pilus assembly protein TadD
MTRRELYTFDSFRLDVADRRLSKGDVTIRLAPKAHDLLVALVREAGRLVTKQELLTRVWADAFVEEGILTVHISSLRRALGDGNRTRVFVETVSRSGYRFVAPVVRILDDSAPAVRGASHPVHALEQVGCGRSHLLSVSYFELPRAVTAFQSAIEMDPTYAAAHAGLALARCWQAMLRALPHAEAYAEAKASALRALAMDNECDDAQVALGVVLLLSEWDWAGAERTLRRALELNPGHTEAYFHYGSLMEALGQLDDGLRLKQMALARNPVSPLVLIGIAMSYWHQRRYDDALTWARRALEIDPRHLLAREFLVGAYMEKGDFDAVARENVTHAESFGAPANVVAHIKEMGVRLKIAYTQGGRAAVAKCVLQHMPAPSNGAGWIQRALFTANAGDLDAAFESLDHAIKSRDPSLIHLAVAPQWDGLRADPRFAERLSRMRLTPRLT